MKGVQSAGSTEWRAYRGKGLLTEGVTEAKGYPCRREGVEMEEGTEVGVQRRADTEGFGYRREQIQRGWGTEGSRYREVRVQREADTERLGYRGEQIQRGLGTEGSRYRVAVVQIQKGWGTKGSR